MPYREMALACALSLGLTPAFRAAARRWGLLDRPNARSSHRGVVPRGGGAAIVAAVLVVLAVARAAWQGRAEPALLILGAVALAGVGLWDDRHGLPASLRLGAQTAVATIVATQAGAVERLPLPAPLDVALGPAGAVVTIVWVVGVVNFFNFLDGIDGLAAIQACVTAAGVMLAAWDPLATLLAAAVAGAALGFLPFNWSPATVFLGDVGSYFLGYTLAVLPLAAPAESRSRAVLFVALSLWLFLADAAYTLARRMWRGGTWYEAHREHLYQQLALRRGHPRVTTAIAAGALVLTAGALAAFERASPALEWAVLVTGMLLFAIERAAAGSGSPSR